MASPWIDQSQLRKGLARFFRLNRSSVVRFGSTVNQTFEAFVFASVCAWYSERKWDVHFMHPGGANGSKHPLIRLKFSTRGKPSGCTYARCTSKKKARTVEVRHQLRVETQPGHELKLNLANVCLDVAVIVPTDLTLYSTDTALPNPHLVTFGEAKHMSAFAELVANFIGLVHEMQPKRLRCIRRALSNPQKKPHPAPFLYVSGTLYPSAQGLVGTVRGRGYDIDVYDQTRRLTAAIALPAAMKKPSGELQIHPHAVGSYTDADIPY